MKAETGAILETVSPREEIMRARDLLMVSGDVLEVLRIPKAGRLVAVSGYFDDPEACSDDRDNGLFVDIQFFWFVETVSPRQLRHRSSRPSLLPRRLAETALHHVIRIRGYRAVAPQPAHHVRQDHAAVFLPVLVDAP